MNFSTNRQSLFCGNDRIAVIMEISDEISIMTWKTLRVSHNPLEKTSSFPHFTQKHLLLKKGNYNCRQREIIVDIKHRFQQQYYLDSIYTFFYSFNYLTAKITGGVSRIAHFLVGPYFFRS